MLVEHPGIKGTSVELRLHSQLRVFRNNAANAGGLRDLGVSNIVHQARIRRRLACAGAAVAPPPPPPPRPSSGYQQALAQTAPVAANRRFSGRL